MQTVACGPLSSSAIDVDGNPWIWGCGPDKLTKSKKVPAIVKITRKQLLTCIHSVSLGCSHSLFLDTDGNVWSCGWNRYGQLGLGLRSDKTVKLCEKIQNLPRIIYAITKFNHSIFIDAENNVWVCGHNSDGQLGVGDKENSNAPILLTTLPKIQFACCGQYHSIFIDTEGKGWACGANFFGQLGIGLFKKKQRETIKQIEFLQTKVISASAGSQHTIFLDTNGNAWGCGATQQHQLGENVFSCFFPIKIEFEEEVFITQVCCGFEYSLFLDAEGFVWGCGQNLKLQLGIGPVGVKPSKISNLPKICHVSASDLHSMFLDTEGKLWSCGNSGLGRSFQNKTISEVERLPVLATTVNENHYYAVKSARI